MTPGRAALAIRASLEVAAQGEGSVEIAVTYRRASLPSVSLVVTPAVVGLQSGDNTFPVTVDLGPCLRDADARLPGAPSQGCFIDIELILRDGGGRIIDRVVQSPQEPVSPETTITLPPITLGSVSVVTVSPPTPTLLPGDSVQLTATPQTRTGEPLSRPVTFSTSDPNVATVSTTGKVTAVGIGSATITATSDIVDGIATVTVRSWTEAEAGVLSADALGRLTRVTAGIETTTPASEGIFLWGGLLADEWRSGDTFSQRNEVDQRNVSAGNLLVNATYRNLLESRRAAQRAIAAYSRLLSAGGIANPNAARVVLALLYLNQGFMEVLIAEHFCSGTAFTDVDPVTARAVYANRETTDQTFSRALASFSAAEVAATQAGAEPGASLAVQVARVGRARAQLGLNNLVSALGLASQVPATFQFTATYTGAGNDQNAIWNLNFLRRGYTVADSEGTNGLTFRSSADPRLPVVSAGMSQDAITPLWQQQRYASATAPVLLGSGVEAALIRAEVHVAQNNQAQALSEINSVRAMFQLPPLSQFVTIDLLMRERAFTLWGTGHRLGDLRRLLRRYGRAGGQSFPTGNYPKGGTYGTDVNFPISNPGDGNPNHAGCIDRNP